MTKRKNLFVLLAAVILVSAMLSSCSHIGHGDTTDPTSSGTLPYDGTRVPGSSADASTLPTPDGTTAPGGDETTAAPQPGVTYTDPLTGLESEADLRRVLPVSIVLDNLSAAAPQAGISRADILIEVLVEGGITRLIMITNEYGGSEVYGPVRSTRHYAVSLAQAFGTLMVGAGGSPLGYTMIKSLDVPYLDGVNDRYSGVGFYRDPARLEKAGTAHSLMTSGERILKLAARHNWSTSSQGTVRPVFNFMDADSKFAGSGDATHVCIPYSNSQYVQMIYSRTSNTYYRYQLGDRAHLDSENGEQLNFTNVFILFADTAAIADDTEGRIDVTTTGEGSGYYISGGRYVPIKWSRIGDTSPFVFTDESGAVLQVTPGKSFISVAPSSIKGKIEFNYKAN